MLVTLTESASKWGNDEIFALAKEMKQVQRIGRDYEYLHKYRDYQGATRRDTSYFFNLIAPTNNNGNNNNGNNDDSKSSDEKKEDEKEKEWKETVRGLKSSYWLINDAKGKDLIKQKKNLKLNLDLLKVQIENMEKTDPMYEAIKGQIDDIEDKIFRIPPIFSPSNLKVHQYYSRPVRCYDFEKLQLEIRIEDEQSLVTIHFVAFFLLVFCWFFLCIGMWL